MLSGEDRMPFGKHKDERLEDVPEKYLAWLQAQDWLEEKFPALAAYLETLDLPDQMDGSYSDYD